jgi:hypothetical protein
MPAAVDRLTHPQPGRRQYSAFLTQPRPPSPKATSPPITIGSGLWILSKRLERGTYAPPVGEGQSQCLRPEELTLLIHGIESASRRAWHRV